MNDRTNGIELVMNVTAMRDMRAGETLWHIDRVGRAADLVLLSCSIAARRARRHLKFSSIRADEESYET